MEPNFLLDSIKGRSIFFSLRRCKPKFIASMDFRVFRLIFFELHKNTEWFWMMYQKINCGLSLNQKCEGFRLHIQKRKRTSEHKDVQTAAAEGHILSLRFFFWWSYGKKPEQAKESGNILGDWRKQLLCGSGQQPLRKDCYYEHQPSMHKLS